MPDICVLTGSSLSRTSSRTSRGDEAASPHSKPGGTVLSVAPLMGCEPDADPIHAQWLHVHVRPPVRALLKARPAPSRKTASCSTCYGGVFSQCNLVYNAAQVAFREGVLRLMIAVL